MILEWPSIVRIDIIYLLHSATTAVYTLSNSISLIKLKLVFIYSPFAEVTDQVLHSIEGDSFSKTLGNLHTLVSYALPVEEIDVQ